VLEEPPPYTSLILLTENPQELLPTIRSRVITHRLGALPAAELEALLCQRRPELKPTERVPRRDIAGQVQTRPPSIRRLTTSSSSFAPRIESRIIQFPQTETTLRG